MEKRSNNDDKRGWKEIKGQRNKYRGGTSDATFRRHSLYIIIIIIIFVVVVVVTVVVVNVVGIVFIVVLVV